VGKGKGESGLSELHNVQTDMMADSSSASVTAATNFGTPAP